MVFRGIFLFLMLGMSLSIPQDMSGKMLTFPLETGWDHMRITTSTQYLPAATVCLRFFTDLTRGYSVLSMATLSHHNSFLIFKKEQSGEIQVIVRDTEALFKGQDYRTNTWQSVCATWNSNTGLTQLWLNGVPSSRKFTSTAPITGPMIIVLGQEQDSHGGGFDINQSFVGMISDLHMWNYELSPAQISNFSNDSNSGNYSHNCHDTNGKILSWDSLEFQTTGKVLTEDLVV